MNDYSLDWSDLAFGSKKLLRQLKATFIAAPRELSVARLTELAKTYLPQGNIVLGIAKEPYVLGLEDQPQFRMLRDSAVSELIGRVNVRAAHKIYTLHYFQRESKYLFEKTDFQRAVFMNGSWKYTFHTSEVFYALVKNGIAYELLSPFADEVEARAYEVKVEPEIHAALSWPAPTKPQTAEQMVHLAGLAARQSYDYSFQTGAVLGRSTKAGRYTFLAAAFNKVVPFQTYALHYGGAREKHFSPPGDLNYYDAVHAEVELLIAAVRDKINLKKTTLFINLLPCPTCARMICDTDIAEVVYTRDHSDGYAVGLLEKAGKNVRRHTSREV